MRRWVTLKDLIETALKVFVPHPGVETEEKAVKILEEEFMDVISDVNVPCFIVACFHLKEDAKADLIPGISREIYGETRASG